MPPPPSRAPPPELHLTLNLTNASNVDVPCPIVLARSRVWWTARLADACRPGVPPDRVLFIGLVEPNETQPCLANVLMRPDTLDAESIRLCLRNGSASDDGVLPLYGEPRYVSLAPGSLPMPIVDIAAGGALFALLFACLVAWLAWRRWRRWRRLTIFLSYRVHSDQPLVRLLYERLLAHKLSVWWDVECLKPGQPWEDGFADGLFGSAIFVPVLSKAALASFATLAGASRHRPAPPMYLSPHWHLLPLSGLSLPAPLSLRCANATLSIPPFVHATTSGLVMRQRPPRVPHRRRAARARRDQGHLPRLRRPDERCLPYILWQLLSRRRGADVPGHDARSGGGRCQGA